jgi:predicted RNase H-related nuclease YkuK (DUF458 family)
VNSICFKNSYGKQLGIKEIVAEIISFMKADKNRSYKITIGTDSELYSKNCADFVTAVVVHRIGNGGKYFWRDVKLQNFYTIRDRIIKEVLLSLDIAKDVINELERASAPKFTLEVHVDVGENGESGKMIQELVGMIRAHSLEAKTKPESYAASSIADRHI